MRISRRSDMNLYLVVSESLDEVIWEDRFNRCGHLESYRIAELVVARSHGHARWLAYQSDRRGGYPSLEDMPKMAVRLKRRNVDGEPGIVTKQYNGIASDELWILDNAPHIGFAGDML